MDRLVAVVSGLLFGVGVTLSGMVNPAKVLNFMDIAGQWDPTLIFVMGAALVVTFIGYKLVLARPQPFFEACFILPTSTRVDARLIAGAVMFGLGWGLTGFCPGPAVASLVFGYWQSWVFVAAMALGIIGLKMIAPRSAALTGQPSAEG
jgi:uncharacterized membrane protein YedE/YeeE